MFEKLRTTFATEWLGVVLLVILGGILRFANFPQTLFWTNDVSRDMLVSWQIATLDRWPAEGHFNTGVQGYYQPYYFYFLGLLAQIGGAPDFIYGSFIVLHTVSLVGIYLMGKQFFSKAVGFGALGLSAIAGGLINLAHFPTVAPWSWPVHILCLTLVSFWFATRQRNYLWMAAAISFMAIQVHGAQLVLLVMVLVLVIQQKLTAAEWLGLFGAAVVLLINQQPLIASVVMPTATTGSQIGWQGLAVITGLFTEVAITHRVPFMMFCGLFGAGVLVSFLQGQRIVVTQTVGWQFLLSYLLVFECLLSLQKTGTLAHHQFYILPVVIILAVGFVFHLQLPVSRVQGGLYRGTLFVLFAIAITFGTAREVGAPQDYVQTKMLFNQLKQQGYPVQTATVFITDTDKSRPGDASNSTQLWWFLATELKRNDFNPVVWSFVNFSPELLLVCNQEYTAASDMTCDDQFDAILSKSPWQYRLMRTAVLAENFLVHEYRAQD